MVDDARKLERSILGAWGPNGAEPAAGAPRVVLPTRADGTVDPDAHAGAIARTARRILMNEDVVREFVIEVDEKADPEYRVHRARDRARTREFMKGLGLMD